MCPGLQEGQRRGDPPPPLDPSRRAQPAATTSGSHILALPLPCYFSQLFPSYGNYHSRVQMRKLRLREAQRGMSKSKGQGMRPRVAPNPGVLGQASSMGTISPPTGHTSAQPGCPVQGCRPQGHGLPATELLQGPTPRLLQPADRHDVR